jgi:predicted dinucleotide-binding enzyme
VVVDISNPIDVEAFERILPEAGSGAEELAAAAPNARVVKAFNTTFATMLAGGGTVAGQPLDVFIASDDEDAKAAVPGLPRTAACGPSMPARWGARTSSRRSATCTWSCRSRSAPGSRAP